jgi:predicted enzyme related to lactoylglutathione lyase
VSNAINWFEIPATDFSRAVSFYRTILGQEIREGEFMGVPHGFLPAGEGGVTGAIVAPEDAAPAAAGALIYLNAGAALDEIVNRIGPAGGRVVQPRTSIAPQGAMAIFIDSEGNRVALHEPAGA